MLESGREVNVAELEADYHFPNLLQDTDYVLYSWTLNN